MGHITEAELVRAKKVAQECLWSGNGLINAASRGDGGDDHLLGVIKYFYRNIDFTFVRHGIDALTEHIPGRPGFEPHVYEHIVVGTAHELAWKFADHLRSCVEVARASTMPLEEWGKSKSGSLRLAAHIRPLSGITKWCALFRIRSEIWNQLT